MANADSPDESVPARVAEVYAELDEVRALIQLIPIFGGPIDTLIAGRGAQIVRRRIEALIEEVRKRADRLEKEKVDHSFVESEEFDDLVMRAFRAASATRDREKIRVYAAILVGSASTKRPPDLDPEAALSAVAELSPTELELAKVIFDHVGPHGGPQAWGNPYEWLPAQFKSDLEFHLNRIERTGLILQTTQSPPVGRSITWYSVTPTFARIMDSSNVRTPNGPFQRACPHRA
jgi:hypothetical protein